ncbi:hypothetical protein IV203_013887 [Nitzschia inconspicua]|uniref:Uncharacterized protein n=1 Tax=Nitzschia inconspicua TaxID=303405 RepID=A0A9K3M6B6_9STRA|nr:hypothetical protein IV203_013887 [Nitzschia inconspicua]
MVLKNDRSKSTTGHHGSSDDQILSSRDLSDQKKQYHSKSAQCTPIVLSSTDKNRQESLDFSAFRSINVNNDDDDTTQTSIYNSFAIERAPSRDDGQLTDQSDLRPLSWATGRGQRFNDYHNICHIMSMSRLDENAKQHAGDDQEEQLSRSSSSSETHSMSTHQGKAGTKKEILSPVIRQRNVSRTPWNRISLAGEKGSPTKFFTWSIRGCFPKRSDAARTFLRYNG